MEYVVFAARNAIFKLIGQFLHAVKFDDGELYLCTYCESVLEDAFAVLGICENHIKVMDFCKLWEENNRKIWERHLPDKPFDGLTAEMLYQVFKKDYDDMIQHIDDTISGDY